MADKIIKNEARCRKCGEIVESTPTNPRKTCSCGALTVDGGVTQLIREGEFIEMTQFYMAG